MLPLRLPHTPRPWSRWLAAHARPSETIFVTTNDNVRLAIHRVRPPLHEASGAPVVMLLHGLAANRLAFLWPQRSLAVHLAQRGFDVYVPELRGAGESETPSRPWDLDDYLTLDLPAILEGIRRAAGTRPVHWVGHSMGGILMCCYAIRIRDHGIASGVAIGSALDYRVGRSGFSRLYAARAVVSRLPAIPFGAFSHAIAPLLGRVRTPIETFNFWPTNVEPELIRAFYANVFEWIPTSLLLSLGTTFEETGLCSRDRSLRYLDCAARIDVPVLLLAASRDEQCPLEAVEETGRRIGAHARVERFGRAFGHADEYGHCDLIVGRRAPQEVWPVIERFSRQTRTTA
ncbi:MAG: alpha/beta fold hydrolase [Myxococcaceae bacterium]|nr:alpha/beta fold hydrolase [Myxococcaceae bacterium]